MELEPVIERNGIQYILIGDYYYPDLLPAPEEEDERMNQIVRQMAERFGVNEELKERDSMQWVGLMNNLKSCARELMNEEYPE